MLKNYVQNIAINISYIYRCTQDTVNRFIEIPEDKDYSSYGRETFKIDFNDEPTNFFGDKSF